MLRKIKSLFAAAAAASIAFSSCADSMEESSVRPYNKAEILGEWYSESIGGSLKFSKNDKMSLLVDLSETMTVDSGGDVHMTGIDEFFSGRSTYDGKNFSFCTDSENGMIDVLTMERTGESSDSVFGEYTLKSGILSDQLTERFGDSEGRYSMIVGENSMIAEIEMCSYTAENGVLDLSGSDLKIFGAEGDNNIAYDFAVQNDVLTLARNGTVMSFAKVSEAETDN